MHRNTGGAGGGGDGVVYIEELGNGASFSVAELKQIAKVDSSHGTNVAPDGVAFGSGSVDAGCSDVKPSNGQGKEVGGIHCIKNINDGSFGNAKSWIGNKKPYKGNVFVGIRFKKPIWLKAIALSRDNTGSNNDRRAGTKQIQYTSDHNPGIDTTEWSNVGEAVSFSGPKQKIFSTTEVAVTAIRVVMSAPSDALDEIQVFGTPILSDKEQDVASGLKYVKSQIGLLQKTKVTAGASSVSGFGSIQTFFRKGNYKWTKPKGCKRIKVFVTGGGGGGGSHNTDDAHGGGGSGGTAIKMINVEKIQSAQLTVGAGGLGAVGNRQAAPTNCIGGNSVFDSKVGDPQTGLGGRQVLRWGIGAVGGIAKGGEINLVGGKGHSGNIDGCGSSEVGGNGGDSFWHGGGAGATGWANRTPGKYGGGGGGNMGNRPDSESTGRGGDGVVVVEEYY